MIVWISADRHVDKGMVRWTSAEGPRGGFLSPWGRISPESRGRLQLLVPAGHNPAHPSTGCPPAHDGASRGVGMVAATYPHIKAATTTATVYTDMEIGRGRRATGDTWIVRVRTVVEYIEPLTSRASGTRRWGSRPPPCVTRYPDPVIRESITRRGRRCPSALTKTLPRK